MARNNDYVENPQRLETNDFIALLRRKIVTNSNAKPTESVSNGNYKYFLHKNVSLGTDFF